MASALPSVTSNNGYQSMLNGPTIIYVSASIIGSIIICFAALMFWRHRRNRRLRALGIDPHALHFAGTRPVLLPSTKPEFFDVYLDGTTTDYEWRDIKPFSCEEIHARTYQCPQKKRVSLASSLFTKFSSSASTLCVNEEGRSPLPRSLQLSVFVAMPSASEKGAPGENGMAVGMLSVPYNGPPI